MKTFELNKKEVVEYVIESAVQNGWDTAKENGYLRHRGVMVAFSAEWIEQEALATVFAREMAVCSIESAIEAAQGSFGDRDARLWETLKISELEKMVADRIR